MNGAQKTHFVAGGVVLGAVVTSLLIWLSIGQLAIGKHSFRVAFSVVLAFSLVRRATWARWFVGILSVLSLAMSLFVLFDWQAFESVMLSWMGIWMALMTIFYIWVAYTLLFDREVIAYFKTKNTPAQDKNEEPEQGGDGDAEEAV